MRVHLQILVIASLAILPIVSGSDCPAEALEQELSDEAAVLAAIDTVFNDPLSNKSQAAAKIVIDYSQGTDKVNVVVAKGLGYYPGNEYTEALLTQYIAAVVKYGLENPSKAGDERSGIPAGLTAAIALYKKIKTKDPSFKVTELDAAENAIRNGEIRDIINDYMERAKKDRETAATMKSSVGR